MAKLIIFRGDTPHDQVELAEKTVRIGRSPQNEIVLDDPGRGVSRTHAEIRFEGGRYVLYDHESQNGIWVSGMRVPSVVLDPGVVAAVGPFRLSVEAAVPVAAPALTDTGTEYTHVSERAAAPLELGDLGPPPAQQPQPAPAATAPPKTPAPAGAKKVAPSTAPAWYAQPRTLLVAGTAAVLIVVLGAVAYKLLQKPERPTWDRNLAQALVDSGRCQEALDTQITPALNADPANAEAIALRDRCAAPPPAEPAPETTTIPPGPTAGERLDGAEALLVAKDCAPALDAINAVLAEDPANERAKDLFAKAQACANPQPTPTVTTQAAPARKQPSEGGLDRRQGESEADYKARVQTTRSRYDEAVAHLQERRYLQALKIFDQLLAEGVPEGYLELEKLRGEARAAQRAEARRAFDLAQAAEARGDPGAASEAYRRAHDLDTTINVTAAIQRVEQQKLQLGEKRCEEAKVAFLYSKNEEAAAKYREVLKLLSPSHSCYGTAQEQLKKLGK